MASILSKVIPFYIRYGLKEFLLPDRKGEKSRIEFYSQLIKKDDLVFDIGANMGNRIGPMLKIGARVVAVEPQKECIKYLRLKFGNKINIVDKALGTEQGIKELFVANTHNTISSFSHEWIDAVKTSGRFPNTDWNKKLQIEMTTFDEVIKTYGSPAFAKVDVEGYELEVFSGLSTPLKCLSFEYTVPEQTDKVLACINKLSQISSAIECNYSKGEQMKFAMDRWITVAEMINLVNSKSFSETRFGDIYIRKIIS
jgi:FkbM family methyltransferase